VRIRNSSTLFPVTVLLALFLVVTPLSFSGEATVRQGPVEPTKEVSTGDQIFRSPMIIETELPAPAPTSGSERPWHKTNEFERYVCDTVRIRELRTYVWEGRKETRVWVGVMTYTEPGVDKKVRIDLEVYTPSGIIGKGSIKSINAEEDETGHGVTRIRVPKSKWTENEHPQLRLSVFVTKDSD